MSFAVVHRMYRIGGEDMFDGRQAAEEEAERRNNAQPGDEWDDWPRAWRVVPRSHGRDDRW